MAQVNALAYAGFLSTPSARRATKMAVRLPFCIVYFYPRPPRGGRRRLSAVTVSF